MLGWHACADRLLRGAIPIAPLQSLPSSLFTHGRWVHAVNILIITENDLSQKMPCIHRANLLIISGHFHFCLTHISSEGYSNFTVRYFKIPHFAECYEFVGLAFSSLSLKSFIIANTSSVVNSSLSVNTLDKCSTNFIFELSSSLLSW